MKSSSIRYPLFCLLAVAGVGIAIIKPRFGESLTLTGPPEVAKLAATRDAATPIEHLKVEAIGRDFGWVFRLPGADGSCGTADDVELGDQLHLPIDCDVELVLKSADYVYVFSIPKLKLREIAVPELTFQLRFRTNKPGTYEVLADPLCGVRLFHDEKMGQVTIQPPASFRQSLAIVAGRE